MLKERFIAVNNLIESGSITILYRDPDGQVEVRLPQVIWMQLTAEDLVRSIQGNLNRTFDGGVEWKVIFKSHDDVIIRLLL